MSGRSISVALGFLIFLTALAFGGVHEWASALAEVALWGLGAVWLITRGPDRRWRGLFPLYAYLAFQLLPLPPSSLTVLSPRTAELYGRTVDRIEGLPALQGDIRPVAGAEDRNVPVAVRQRIREVLRADDSWFPRDWRSIALYPFAARGDLLLYLSYGIALWLAATVSAPRLLLRLVIAAGVAIALLGIVELITWNGHVLWFFDPYESGPMGDYKRMLGSFVNPDHFAAFLELLVAPGAALLVTIFRGRRDARRGEAEGFLGGALLGVGLAILVAALVGSASRGGIVGAMLSVAVLGWGILSRRDSSADGTHRQRRRKENRVERVRRLVRRFAPAAAAAAILLGGVLYAGPKARETLNERIGDTRVASEFTFRSAMTLQTLPIIRDFPLFGVGAGCWREVFRQYESYPMVGFRPNHAHNDYVEWVAEVGIVGLLATAVAAWTLIGAVRRNRAVPEPIRWGVFGATAGIAWHEAYEFGLRAPANALLLAVLLGLACNRNWRRGAEEETDERGRAANVMRTVFAAVVAAALVALSVRQFREFLQWSSVQSGSTELTIDPGNAETWDELATRLYAAGFRYQPPTGECLRAAVHRRPAFEGAFWRMSFTATAYPEKLAMLDAALYLDPTRAAWRVSYASLLDSLGRSEDALAEIEKATYRSPRLADHPYLDPQNHPSEALLEAAERGFRRAVADWPNDPELLAEVASFYERFGIWGDAGSLLAKAAEASGDWAYYGRRAGSCYANGANFERAETLLRKSIAADPSQTEGYRLLVTTVLLPEKRIAEADEALALGIRRSRRPAPLYATLYEIRRARGDVPSALQALAKAAELEPRNADSQSRLGAAYLEAEDYHRAKIAFDHAIAIDPMRGVFHYQKARAEERLYDLGGALADYRKAAALDPKNGSYAADAERLARVFEGQKRGGERD